LARSSWLHELMPSEDIARANSVPLARVRWSSHQDAAAAASASQVSTLFHQIGQARAAGTGEIADKRAAAPADQELTAQEAQIARLARDGLSRTGQLR
jgi:hypothetical protein